LPPASVVFSMIPQQDILFQKFPLDRRMDRLHTVIKLKLTLNVNFIDKEAEHEKRVPDRTEEA
ncbi:MAG: hypothetical protein VB025_09015, partial [Sphaerochaeta sp.]|nr:hypothetical protein [Sphaerochaeta sp.]